MRTIEYRIFGRAEAVMTKIDEKTALLDEQRKNRNSNIIQEFM